MLTNLEERVYSVLVVSAGENLNTALSTIMSKSHYSPLKFVSNIAEAKRQWCERDYDFLIINSPLPDDTGVRFAIDTVASSSAIVLFLVRSELSESMKDKLFGTGVLTLAKPLNRISVIQALEWMASFRERLKKIEVKTLSIEDKMKEIRVVNKAKWLLISVLKMDEPQAHRYIEKQAMDACISKKEVADRIIKTYS
ncbi:MAG: ANTAR domain-containing protein [Spirochaetales bacterium]|nr:ANTAR domain-containing protein [Spirochaetales bacterium]